MGNCEVITKLDNGSDHRMVRARVDMNKKLLALKKTKLKKNTKKPPFRLDLGVLEQLATPFRIELKKTRLAL